MSKAAVVGHLLAVSIYMDHESTMQDDEPQFDPRDYMKSRRPHLFSDSGEIEAAPISKDQFDFHLETLTNRQEETPFERFGRDLVKKEICPNLIPHTGPTGGGDGKTDSETYPVSEEIAALWWTGDPKRASNERYAFCFSAKKDWKSKFKSDIESVMSTVRNFTVVYFMTNQYVSSRERAALQDEYTRRHNCDVRILDRTWILEAVFDHQHWDAVAKHFDIKKTVVKVDGPRDAQRKRDLEALEKELACAEFQGVEFAENCLSAALLARGLNLPRYQIDGMFDRAERASEKVGSRVQLFRFIYRRAWTAYYWFNDFAEMSRLYDKAESLVLHDDSPFILQDLGNLCQIGLAVTRDPNYANLRQLWFDRSQRLTDSLSKICSATPGTAGALWAQTQIHMSALALGGGSNDAVTNFSTAIHDMLPEVRRYADYPIQVLLGLVEEFGDYIVDNAAFDDLFEALMTIEGTRTSEAVLGQRRLRRGLQFLEKGKWYQAIDQLSKAQPLLAKEEQHDSYVASIFLTGIAYRDAGLFWAARGNIAVAVSIAVQNKLKFGHLVPPRVVRMMQEFALTEIALGRMFCALQVLEMSLMISSHMKLPAFIEQTYQFIDFVMARHIIETPFGELKQLKKIPDILRQYLLLSYSTLCFCLGYEQEAAELIGTENFEEIAKEIVTQTDEALDDDFVPEWYVGSEHVLQSKLLGCVLEVKTEDLPGILIGESLLAFLEDFLATAVMLERCMATCPAVSITINNKAGTGFEVCEEETDAGETIIIINYSFDNIRDFADPRTYPEDLFKAIIPIIKQMRLALSEESLVKLFEEHEALTRSQFGASSFTSVLKLFGEKPKYLLDQWTSEFQTEIRSYEAKRLAVWSGKSPESKSKYSENKDNSTDVRSSKITDIQTLRHTELSVQSPINFPVWEKAKWDGTAFGTIEGDLSRIEFWLTFDNIEAARKIFLGWRKKVGAVDGEEWLGISIITGINEKNPAWYRVVISINEDHFKKLGKSSGLMVITPAKLDMMPTSTTNLDRFLKAYNQAGWYDLGPAKGIPGLGVQPEMDLTIRKRSLVVIPAWQISGSSVLCMALHGIENPVIPDNVTAPPFRTAYEKYHCLSKELPPN
jgi:hypothetical protein